MKKIANILFAVSFSVFMLTIGAGVNIVKCNHSGNFKILSILLTVNEDDFSCNPAHDCMETDFVKYSPDKAPDFQSFDFSMAVTAVLSSEFWNFKTPKVLCKRFHVKNKQNPPPKNFLSFIEVFRN